MNKMRVKDIFQKLKIYGPIRFIQYSLKEIYRMTWLQKILKSYSQNGEDLLIHKILKNKKKGFYVDVGANDPVRFSNTKHFYNIGWRGINIEPSIDCFSKIKNDRKKDINLNFGIGRKTSKITFYQFYSDTLSTFSKKEFTSYLQQGYKLRDVKLIKIETLAHVFDKYLKNIEIDFLTVDTEGYDKEVLMSNDWNKYRPKIICIESVCHTIKGKRKSSGLEKVLTKIGYNLFYDNGLNSIYVDRQQKV